MKKENQKEYKYYKLTVILTEQEYRKALIMMKPGEKRTDFIKRKIFSK